MNGTIRTGIATELAQSPRLSACWRFGRGTPFLLLALLLVSGCGTANPPGPYAYPGTPAAAPPDPGFPSTSSGVRPPSVFDLDQSVATLIRQSLKETPDVAQASRKVRFKVAKGVVTLRGTVPTEAARSLVVEKVNRVPGVDGVQDEMVIR